MSEPIHYGQFRHDDFLNRILQYIQNKGLYDDPETWTGSRTKIADRLASFLGFLNPALKDVQRIANLYINSTHPYESFVVNSLETFDKVREEILANKLGKEIRQNIIKAKPTPTWVRVSDTNINRVVPFPEFVAAPPEQQPNFVVFLHPGIEHASTLREHILSNDIIQRYNIPVKNYKNFIYQLPEHHYDIASFAERNKIPPREIVVGTYHGANAYDKAFRRSIQQLSDNIAVAESLAEYTGANPNAKRLILSSCNRGGCTFEDLVRLSRIAKVPVEVPASIAYNLEHRRDTGPFNVAPAGYITVDTRHVKPEDMKNVIDEAKALDKKIHKTWNRLVEKMPAEKEVLKYIRGGMNFGLPLILAALVTPYLFE